MTLSSLTQRVLVTAGASGIGEEVARAFAATAAAVCVCDLDRAALQTAANEIPGLWTEVCDVSRREEVERMVPGEVAGPRIEKVFEGRAEATGQPLDEIRKQAMSVQSLKRLVDPKDIAALAVFLASDSAKSISGQVLPIDNDMQSAQ